MRYIYTNKVYKKNKRDKNKEFFDLAKLIVAESDNSFIIKTIYKQHGWEIPITEMDSRYNIAWARKFLKKHDTKEIVLLIKEALLYDGNKPKNKTEIVDLIKQLHGLDYEPRIISGLLRNTMKKDVQQVNDTDYIYGKLERANKAENTIQEKVSEPTLSISNDNQFENSISDIILRLTKINSALAFKGYGKINSNFEIDMDSVNPLLEEESQLMDEVYAHFTSHPSELDNYKAALGRFLYSRLRTHLEENIDGFGEDQEEEVIPNNECSDIETNEYSENNFAQEYPFVFEMLPKSLLYESVPSKEEFRNNLQLYKTRLINSCKELNEDQDLLNKSLIRLSAKTEKIEDWDLIYKYVKHYLGKETLRKNKHGLLIEQYAQSPFKYFLSLLESEVEQINFDENERFKDIINEVGWDNHITEAEKDLLFFKGDKLGIDKAKIELYLDNDFRNYPSFLLLINEICEDGIIDDEERAFIEEKAEVYKIPKDTLESMIDTGLFKVNSFNELKEKNHFKDIVIIYLISNAIELNNHFLLEINTYISKLHKKINGLNESLTAYRNTFIEKFVELLNTRFNLNIIDSYSDLRSILSFLDINLEDFNFDSLVSPQKLINDQFGWSIYIDVSLNKPIQINRLEKKIIFRRNENEVELLYSFIENLFNEKSKHRNPEVDLFFENFEEFYNE